MSERDPLHIRIKRRLGPILNVPAVNRLRGVPMPDVTGEAAQIAIARLLVERGRLIARVGETEGRTAAWRLTHRLGRAVPEPYQPQNRERLKLLAGYFPTTDAAIDRLADLYLDIVSRIDLYAAWTPHDRLLAPRTALKCRLIDIDPFFTEVQWSRALAGRRVTVVSPFKATILEQWKHRDRLFAAGTMPDCTLSVVQAPQTNCEVDTSTGDWFANLDALNHAVDATEPEIVIIGAGAYGLPVAHEAARRGASAMMMGGTTQLLFGIMGNRWLLNPRFVALQTDAWTRPGAIERPPGFTNFETRGGAYW